LKRLLVLLCLSAATGGVSLAQPAATPMLSALQAELDRSMQHLKSQPTPPYFLSYEVSETHRIDVSGSFGTLTRSRDQRRRNLDIDLRVGDCKFDNTRPIRGGAQDNRARYSWVEMPTDDNADA